MVIEESDLKFLFPSEVCAVKFDDCEFYRKEFNKLLSAKGVDILADSKEVFQFIEVKNCSGHEGENLWRTSVNNSRIHSAPRDLDVSNRDSLDIEVTKKVVSTIACLAGAWTKSGKMEKAAELRKFWFGLNDSKIPADKKKILVILFLEGNFEASGVKSRSKKMMMSRLQNSIRRKLAWLNCQVFVVDSNTYKERYFQVS